MTNTGLWRENGTSAPNSPGAVLQVFRTYSELHDRHKESRGRVTGAGGSKAR